MHNGSTLQFAQYPHKTVRGKLINILRNEHAHARVMFMSGRICAHTCVQYTSVSSVAWLPKFWVRASVHTKTETMKFMCAPHRLSFRLKDTLSSE